MTTRYYFRFYHEIIQNYFRPDFSRRVPAISTVPIYSEQICDHFEVIKTSTFDYISVGVLLITLADEIDPYRHKTGKNEKKK